MTSRTKILLALLFPLTVMPNCGFSDVGRSPGCAASSASDFFGGLLDVDHEGTRAAQGLHFAVLSAVGEPSLACDSAPPQAIRVSQRSTVDPARFVARANSNGITEFRSFSYQEPNSKQIKILSQRELTRREWSDVQASISELALTGLRVIALPPPQPEAVLEDKSTMFEIRHDGKYYVAVRGSKNMEPPLAKLLSIVMELAGADR